MNQSWNSLKFWRIPFDMMENSIRLNSIKESHRPSVSTKSYGSAFGHFEWQCFIDTIERFRFPVYKKKKRKEKKEKKTRTGTQELPVLAVSFEKRCYMLDV